MQVVGYEDAPGTGTTTGTTPTTGTTAGTTPATGTTEPQTTSQRTAPEYESSGTETGYEGTGATGAGGIATGGSAVTPADLPKSGVVDTSSGTADITAKQQPGYLSSAAGELQFKASAEYPAHPLFQCLLFKESSYRLPNRSVGFTSLTLYCQLPFKTLQLRQSYICLQGQFQALQQG